MRPDTATTGTPLTCGSQWSASSRSFLIGAGAALDQVPLAHADDQRAAFALDEIGDAKVLLLERLSRVHQQDHHLGEAHGVERVRNRELFEFLLDPGAAAQPGGVVDAKVPVVPSQIDRDGVAGDAGLGAGQQPLLAEQPVDQRRFPGIGPADHRDADRPLRGARRVFAACDVVLVGFCAVPSPARSASGSAARSAS